MSKMLKWGIAVNVPGKTAKSKVRSVLAEDRSGVMLFDSRKKVVDFLADDLAKGDKGMTAYARARGETVKFPLSALTRNAKPVRVEVSVRVYKKK
jgi:hypothetical protein